MLKTWFNLWLINLNTINKMCSNTHPCNIVKKVFFSPLLFWATILCLQNTLNNMECKNYILNFLLHPNFVAHDSFQVWLTFLNFNRLFNLLVGESESFSVCNPFNFISTCATIIVITSKISFTFHYLGGVVVEGHALAILSVF